MVIVFQLKVQVLYAYTLSLDPHEAEIKRWLD